MKLFWAFLAIIVPVVSIYGWFLGNPLVFDDAGFFQGEDFNDYLKIFSLDLRWLPYATFVWTREILGDAIIWLRLGNLLLHLTVVLTLFLFLQRLFAVVLPEQTDDNTLSSFWLACFAALIFAVHPVAVYDAAYLVQRTTLMATLFALLTWRTFLEGVVKQQRSWLNLSAGCYFFAVLSKEHSIMVPAVSVALWFLIDKQPFQRIKLVLPTLVMYFLIALFVVFQVKTRNILGQAYEPVASELISRLSEELDADWIYPLSVLTQTAVFFKYLWLWLVPNPALMSIDTCQTFTLRFWSVPEIFGLIGFIIYPVIAIYLLLQRGLKGLFGFALLCPWLLFFTELATIRIQEIFVLYRSYLWMIGLYASLPFLCQKLTAKQATITLSCIVLFMMPLTWGRLTTFSHPLLLWDDAAHHIVDAKSCPTMDRILNNRATQLMQLGQYQQAIKDLTRSLEVFKWQTKPMVSELAHNYSNRGFSYLKLQQYQLALNDFNVLIEPLPKDWVVFYFYKAQALEGLQEFKAAKDYYQRACLENIKEGCDKQKVLENLIK